MRLTVGNRVESKFSGKIYNVSRITEDWILLEEEGGISQVLTGKKNMDLSFKRLKGGAERRGGMVPVPVFQQNVRG